MSVQFCGRVYIISCLRPLRSHAHDSDAHVTHTQVIYIMGRYTALVLFLAIALFGLAALATPALAVTACWQYDANQSGCQQQVDCTWMTDPWGSWCEQKGCWNLWTQEGCTNSSNSNTAQYFINKSCTWTAGTNSWCEDLGCWSFDGQNQAACENNAAGITCSWENECVGPWEKQCWNLTPQGSANCSAVNGCHWGGCMQRSCGEYSFTNAANCTAATGYDGGSCLWNAQSSYCYESSCSQKNFTVCQADAVNCTWSNGMCNKKSCSDFSYTSEAGCVNGSATLSCTWQSPQCSEKGCWNNFNAGNCSASSKCSWKTQAGGWCQEAGCWNWDNISLQGTASEGGCLGNATAAGLDCSWDGPNGGWCYEDISSKSCADFPSEKGCMDSFYCMWNSSSQFCQAPSFIGGGSGGDFSVWNPGCYVFPDAGNCSALDGCAWNGGTGECEGLEQTGLNCQNITQSSLCNSIPMLTTCCTWQGSSCAPDPFSKKCWDEMQTPPTGATYCEDYNSYTDQALCTQIAGSPWFMPCNWNNGTERCEFKSSKVFQGGESNFMFIDNKQNCEFAGGKWVTESYCDGNETVGYQAVPAGHCEFKFDDEKNCDRSCKACEYKTDGTAWNSSAAAGLACIGSKLGFCTFTADGNAPNGLGSCKVKDQFKKGIASGTCDTECSACTFMGDPAAPEASQRPSSYCKNSKVGCKWLADPSSPSDESKGRCSPLGEKSCDDQCDRCYEQGDCALYGQKKGNSSKSQVCQWDSSAQYCKLLANSGSGSGAQEICWNGEDDNSDGKTDCADSKCFSDPFCGGSFMAGGQDCFGYADSTSCEANSCAWVSEMWGSWCDMPGAACWKKDSTNETFCETDSDLTNDTCEWHIPFGGGFCEMNFEVFDACLSNDYTACTAQSNYTYNCTWFNMSDQQGSGGWCDPAPGYQYNCAQYDFAGENVCNSYPECDWFNMSGGMSGGEGFCDHMKFTCGMFETDNECLANATYSNNGTSPYDWCLWDGFSCFEKPSFGGNCNQWNATECAVNSSGACSAKTGFCDPKGFGGNTGGGEGFGIHCETLNGNAAGCTGQTGCTWMPEPTGFCDADTSVVCPELSMAGAGPCNAEPLCSWNAVQQFCDWKIFECFSNQSRQQGPGAPGNCTESPLCQWDAFGGGCSPKCFQPPNQLGQADCAAINVSNNSTCRWVNGFCGSAMSAKMFKDMQGGQPVMLGVDPDDVTSNYVDIMGHGMKDMGSAYGFGIGVADATGAAMCKNLDVSTGPGTPTVKGTGTNTTRFYWYLDTDGDPGGNSINNCTLKHDSGDQGWEFLFRYTAEWDGSSQSVKETFKAERCLNKEWVVSDIKLSTMRDFACRDIGGGMVAVDKLDLEKFPSLYSSGDDLRVTVSTADETGNITHPTDSVDTATGAGYMTPGTVDFDLDSLDIFNYASNGSTNFGSMDHASRGFVEYDADCWTAEGCADYACYNHPYCVANSLGVHNASFDDTRTPKIIAVSKETYPDAGMVIYFTDKPANGTLEFYRDDSACSSLNATIYDIGITSTYSRDYKLWHRAEVYNDGGVNGLDYSLAPSTKYYYKLRVCDDAGKCAVSKCSSFRTAEPQQCPFCTIVAQIKMPSGWNVSYDVDQDGTFEHRQGSMCGPNAGMKVNYTDGRRVDIRLAMSDNSTSLEFFNARLTKTGLTSKTRDVETEGSFLNGSGTLSGNSGKYVGMLSETRDKIVNSLLPERCRIKVPSSGTCDELWQCSDDLSACVNRTAQATLNTTGADYCIWDLQYCEFSVYFGLVLTPPVVDDDTPPGSSGGGGAVTPATNSTSKKWTTMEPGKEQVMKVYNAAIGLNQLSFEVSEAVANAQVTVTKLGSKPAAAASEAGVAAYRYIDIAKSVLTDSQVKAVKFRFHVEKSWLEEQGGATADVRLFRFVGSQWNELSTVYTDSDATYAYFNATSPGLSYFAIALTKATPPAAAPVEEETVPTGGEEITGATVSPPVEEEETPGETPGEEAEKKGTSLVTVLLVVVLVGLAIAGAGYLYMKRQPPESGERLSLKPLEKPAEKPVAKAPEKAVERPAEKQQPAPAKKK